MYTLNLGNQQTKVLTVKSTSLQNPIGFGNSVGILIILDNLYNTMKSTPLPSTTIFSIGMENMRSNKKLYTTFKKIMPQTPYMVSAYEHQQELVHENSSTLLLILFSTIIFLIATGSILHFYLYMLYYHYIY